MIKYKANDKKHFMKSSGILISLVHTKKDVLANSLVHSVQEKSI